MTPDLIGGLVGGLLTILILSYMFHDTPLYRIALHLLVGATVGYGVAITTYTAFIHTVLPALQADAGNVDRLSIVFPLVMGLLLLLKGFPRSRFVELGNIPLAFLVGVGAAVATAGALLGTVLQQATASRSLLVAVGTICTLLAFNLTIPSQHTLQRLSGGALSLVRKIGRIFLMVAFGAAFGAALTASLTILIRRIYFVADIILQLVQFLGAGG
jgi:hypothetical protein